MNQEQSKAARDKGRVIGGMSGFVFALAWTVLAYWEGDTLGFAVFLIPDAIFIASSAWIGGRIAPFLAQSTEIGLACVLGTLGGLAIDALACILWAMASAPGFHHFSTWLPLLEESRFGIFFVGFGAIPAIPWGIVTSLLIRRSLLHRGFVALERTSE